MKSLILEKKLLIRRRVYVFLSVLVLLFCPAIQSKVTINLEDTKNKKVVGKLTYKKQELIVAKSDGIASKVYVNSGQKLSREMKIVEIKSFDPAIRTRSEYSWREGGFVMESLVREGDKVKKYDVLFRLAKKEDLIATSNIIAHKASYFSLGQKVEVNLSPDSDKKVMIEGEILAIHEVSGSLVPQLKLDIELQLEGCLKSESCETLLKSNRVVLIESIKS